MLPPKTSLESSSVGDAASQLQLLDRKSIRAEITGEGDFTDHHGDPSEKITD